MDISSVLKSYSVQSTTIVQQTETDDSTSLQPSAANADSSPSQVQLSGPGQLMRQLSGLQQSDPDKFKDVVQQLSDSFSTAAQNATGQDATRLTDLANKFAQAAQSGDMSAFQPPQADANAAQGAQGAQGARRAYGHHHGGGHHAEPSQAMKDAFSSAASIVQNATAA